MILQTCNRNVASTFASGCFFITIGDRYVRQKWDHLLEELKGKKNNNINDPKITE